MGKKSVEKKVFQWKNVNYCSDLLIIQHQFHPWHCQVWHIPCQKKDTTVMLHNLLTHNRWNLCREKLNLLGCFSSYLQHRVVVHYSLMVKMRVTETNTHTNKNIFLLENSAEQHFSWKTKIPCFHRLRQIKALRKIIQNIFFSQILSYKHRRENNLNQMRILEDWMT